MRVCACEERWVWELYLVSFLSYFTLHEDDITPCACFLSNHRSGSAGVGLSCQLQTGQVRVSCLGLRPAVCWAERPEGWWEDGKGGLQMSGGVWKMRI